MNEKEKVILIETTKCVNALYERLKEVAKKSTISLAEVIALAVNIIPKHLRLMYGIEKTKSKLESTFNIEIESNPLNDFVKHMEEKLSEKEN